MKIINLSRVGIPKKTFLKIFFSVQSLHPRLPLDCSKGCPQGFPQIFKKAVSTIPPKVVHKAISSKFLTEQPISVPTSHVVVTLSLYIFGIVCS